MTRMIAYATGRTDARRIGAHKLTHINYAFAHVSPEGEAFLPDPEAPAFLARLQALKSRNPRLKILVSVGGWGADHFSDAALTPESRQRFATSAAQLLDRHALDGIDLDWEYPGQPGPGIKHRPEDKQNFTLWLQAIREHLDALSDRHGRSGEDRYLVTIASASGEYFRHTEMDRLHVHLDWINIMTYDLFGPWSTVTGHHTGLFAPEGASADWPCADAAVRQHLEAGIPPEKLVLGAAFYGRSWAGVLPEGSGIGQPYERYAGEHPWSTIAREFLDAGGFRRQWDAAAQAASLWNPETRTLISCDDPESLRAKADYVRSRGLGGIMWWEHSHDPDETLVDALHAVLRPS